MRRALVLIAIAAVPLSGCVIAAAGAAGAIVADEVTETDGKFDPLEEAYDGDDSTTPIIDERDD